MTAGTHDAPHSLSSDIAASAALFVYSVAVAVGFARVFSGWDFLDNLVVIAFVGHALALALRRARVPISIAFPVTAFGLVWLIGAMYYRDTYSLMLPTSQTWNVFRLDLEVVGDSFRTAVAPVPFLAGWDALASLGIAAAVLLSDTFAFRAYARAEALVPGGVLFVFVAALGSDRSRVASTAVLVAAGVIATIVLRQHHAPTTKTTVGRTRGRVTSALPLAIGSALSIGLIAGVLGPMLPGAGDDPIYETRGGGDSGTVTEVVSPLVDIRSRLTNRGTTELFTVQATQASYWRSSALADFDGTKWRIPVSDMGSADGAIGDGIPGSVMIDQEITIAALGGQFVPAAADPVAATGVGEVRNDLNWSPDNATLLKTGDDLATGQQFDVVSASPRFSPETLAAASSVDPDSPIYLDLPDDFPSAVRDIAVDVTAGATSTYDAALKLQNWMQDPEEFTYSLEVQEGHGNNAIESFLRNRVGYCEQFAGTYAAMLRTIGIPTRVAVGFTQGDDNGAGLYSVLGRNAHAWPEVWFDDIGWVPFEPTPGRGAPGATSYTDLEPAQAAPLSDETPTPDVAPPVAAATTTIVAGGGGPGPTTIPTGPDEATDPASDPPASASSETLDDGTGVPWIQLGLLASVGLLIALPALIRRVRRSLASSSGSQLAHLWSRAVDALRATGLDDTASRTPAETADAATQVFPVASRPMHSLAQVVTYVNYAPDGAEHLSDSGQYGVTLLENCAQWVRQVERAVTDSLTPFERVRRYFTHLD